ncbi:MAG: ABC transporter permease [Clostridiales Family XIII bacterium]|jgi:osmoprotectant transport system permease protein|nr:ABC transporter permease [Clostridiales Family XIII bacterium]
MSHAGLIEKIAEYFQNRSDVYLEAVARHLEISFVAAFIACVVGIPLGILSARGSKIRTFITGIFGVFRIIPSLAILLLCIPIIGTGPAPALIALSFLAIPPILINTTQAFAGIPGFLIETAEGMGMSSARIFFTVKAPLSMPIVLAGIKTAVTEVIASATLASYIGAGGLGNLIFTGLGLLRADLLLIGGISVALLSVSADFLLSCAERRLVRYRNPRIAST